MNDKLLFFMSRATSLQRWRRLGIFSREIAIYKKLQQSLDVQILTSGDEEEFACHEELAGFDILFNRWKLSANVYSLFAPLLHWRSMRHAAIYKTNQLDGAWTAIIAGKLYRKPVVVRAGYLWAKNFERQRGKSWKSALIHRLEGWSFKNADHIFLTTELLKVEVVKSYQISADRITIIPNNIDTDLFIPMAQAKKAAGQICFLGRLTPVKNVDLLIKAMANIPNASLAVIGDGEQKAYLAQLAKKHEVQVNFLGLIPNQELPSVLNQSEIFVLPSRFEGHPKALLEAMACGLPVIGTNVEGIRALIEHEENGLLCEPTVTSLRQALVRLLENELLRLRLGEAAQAAIKAQFSLASIAEQELALLQQIQETHKL